LHRQFGATTIIVRTCHASSVTSRKGNQARRYDGDYMQTIYDLSTDEIAALTDEQIAMFIDIECAQKGMPLLPPEPKEPVKPTIEPDKTVYGIGGMYFATSAQAAEVMEVIAKQQQYTYEYKGYDCKVAKPGECYLVRAVSPEKMFSQELYEQHRKALEKYDADKKLYDSEKKRYDEAVKNRSNAYDNIWETVTRAREIESEQGQIQRNYDRYLQIAKGDKDIAFNFLEASMSSGGFEHDHAEFLKRFDFRPQAA
jgi:hypothetical protein